MIFLHKNETNTRFDIVCFLLCVATIEVDKLRMEIFVNAIKKICSENISLFLFLFLFFPYWIEHQKERLDGSYKISIELIRVVELLIYGE